MFSIFYGSDYKKKLTEAAKQIDAAVARDPSAPHLEFESESLTPAVLEECVALRGLFAPRSVIEIRDALSTADTRDAIFGLAKNMVQSMNHFFLIEYDISEKDRGLLKESGAMLNGFNAAAMDVNKNAKKFNIFTLTDALGGRDRKGLWILLQKAIVAGTEPEEIHGIFFWQIKTMLLVAKAGDSASALGIKPFVAQKNQRFLKKYSVAELEGLSRQLVAIYHESRSGGTGLDLALEKFVLTL